MGVVPLAVGGFGNFVVPLQIGAPDMAFPKLNMFSYWSFFLGAVVMLASFFQPGWDKGVGAAQSGWTSYAPLSVVSPGQTLWLVGMIFLITSSLLGSVNFDGYRQNPSWCLQVRINAFIPPAAAVRTIWSASKSVGLNSASLSSP